MRGNTELRGPEPGVYSLCQCLLLIRVTGTHNFLSVRDDERNEMQLLFTDI